MALAATAVWEVRETGSDLNGGAFNPSRSVNGVDRSQQAAPHVAIDGSGVSATVHTTTTQITLSGYTVSNADLGNTLRISGGTATAGLYEITAVDTGNNRWTLDRSAGSSTQTVQGRMGGAFASPGMAAGAATVSGMRLWIRNGLYLITSTTPNVSGGRVDLQINTRLTVEGYNVARGDLVGVLNGGDKPILRASGITNTTLVSCGGNSSANPAIFRSIIADGDGLSGIRGFDLNTTTSFVNNARHTAWYCEARNCLNRGFHDGRVFYSRSTGCGNGGFFSVHADHCVSDRDVDDGFRLAEDRSAANCLAFRAGRHGFNGGADGNTFRTLLVHCTAALCDESGFAITLNNGSGSQWAELLAYGNGGYGFNFNTAVNASAAVLVRCAAGDNTLGTFNNTPTPNDLFVTLSANPFSDSENDDYRLNSDPDGGALLTGLVVPGQGAEDWIGALPPSDVSGSLGPSMHSPYLIGEEIAR